MTHRVLPSLLVMALFAGAAAQASAQPLAPTDLRAEVTPLGVVTLQWNVNAATEPPTSYLLSVGSAPALSDLAVIDTGTPVRSFVAVPPTGRYYVRVSARNANGVSGTSNEVEVTVAGACAGLPVAPINLDAAVNGTFVTLTWQQPLGAQSTTGYIVEVGSAVGRSDLLRAFIPALTTVGSHAGPGLYFVRLRATNACGQSGPSNELVVVVQ